MTELSNPNRIPTSAVHVMHDIETWSTANNPVILSIGAVKFDSTGILERFQVGVDPADCQRYGLHIDAGTVMWWMDDKRQSARDALAKLGKVDLFAALDGYQMWLNAGPALTGSAWAMGATFDHVKLKSAYDACDLDWPITYKQEECYRTMANRFKDVEFVRNGTHHSALDDAEDQALHLIAIAAAHGNFL